MTEEVIEKLCEKFGVTTDHLISELAKQSITLDWIGIIFWIGLSIIATVLCIIFKDKLKDLFNNSGFCELIFLIPIAIYIITLVVIPFFIIDLRR